DFLGIVSCILAICNCISVRNTPC
ncbi:unnamed protein product, partial [Allacma fusca]